MLQKAWEKHPPVGYFLEAYFGYKSEDDRWTAAVKNTEGMYDAIQNGGMSF